MIRRAWSWMGACSTGSSHVRVGETCQDAAACLEIASGVASALLVVVSDGAGSARFSRLGSRCVTTEFSKSVARYTRDGGHIAAINEEIARTWLDVVRDRIASMAEAAAGTPRDFAATLVAALVGEEDAVICHVGDGACVLRQAGTDQWHVPSWPDHGEYASSTYFVTDDPQPKLRLYQLQGRFTDVAVFSDGLERLALDFIKQQPASGFFNPIVNPMSQLPAGRSRGLSAQLRTFLESSSILNRTDDDKTLVVARRVQ